MYGTNHTQFKWHMQKLDTIHTWYQTTCVHGYKVQQV